MVLPSVPRTYILNHCMCIGLYGTYTPWRIIIIFVECINIRWPLGDVAAAGECGDYKSLPQQQQQYERDIEPKVPFLVG